MHPIESSIYYSTMFLPIAFGAHPLVMLYTKMDLTIAALVGHDGVGPFDRVLVGERGGEEESGWDGRERGEGSYPYPPTTSLPTLLTTSLYQRGGVGEWEIERRRSRRQEGRPRRLWERLTPSFPPPPPNPTPSLAAFPGGASHPHWVHHHMREVNFGESYFPMDAIFGTFAATVDDAKKIIDSRIQQEMNAKHSAGAKKGK
jgi:hypothetical protein